MPGFFQPSAPATRLSAQRWCSGMSRVGGPRRRTHPRRQAPGGQHGGELMRNRQHRVWGPDIRALTPTETKTLACCVGEHWPGRPFTRVWIEWNSSLVIDWELGAWPVTQTRLPLDHLQAHAPPPAALPALRLAPRGQRASVGVTAL